MSYGGKGAARSVIGTALPCARCRVAFCFVPAALIRLALQAPRRAAAYSSADRIARMGGAWVRHRALCAARMRAGIFSQTNGLLSSGFGSFPDLRE